MRSRSSGVLPAVVLALLMVPACALADGGRRPSEAPLVSVGHNYFGDTHQEGSNAGCCNSVDLWRLPPLLTADVVTVGWSGPNENQFAGLCLAENVDDYSWAEQPNWCNSNPEKSHVSSSGSARTLLTAETSTVTPYLEFWGNTCCGPQPYAFDVESIQHAIGLHFAPLTSLGPTSKVTGTASLSNGAPVPDGLAFKLTASWTTGAGRVAHHRGYLSLSTAGAISFTLSLPETALSRKIALVLSRPADAQYLAATSPTLKRTLPRPVFPPQFHHHHHHRHRRH